jgi:anti-anti-sigma factor
MPDVRQHITVVRGVPVIEAPAEIDISNAGALRAALQAAAACGYATFVVDMTSTGFCDCAGLQVLENAHRTARAEGGELRLIIPTAGLPHIFAVTGAERVIPTFTSLDEALAETPAITIQALWQPPSMLGILVNLPAPASDLWIRKALAKFPFSLSAARAPRQHRVLFAQRLVAPE